MMSPRTFGQLPGGAPVHAWTLGNTAGASLEVITYGATVTRLRMPDRRGEGADVVLGFDSLGPYLSDHPYFGAVAGRVAGRITGGRFTLDGRTYPLAVNDPPNHLHGGCVPFSRKLWRAEPAARPDGAAAVRLSLESPDGDEGYPGRVEAAVTVALTERNEFIFETEVRSDRPTPASLTHHSYFNLAGEHAGDVTGHEVQILAGAYAPTDDAMTLLGRREAVEGQGCDLRRPRRLGDVLPGLRRAHGDLYFLDRPAGPSRGGDDGDDAGAAAPAPAPVLAARVREPRGGRVLEVRTTEDCLQFYSGASLDGSLRGKSGVPYGPHHGFCLECEGYPDGVNVPALGDILVRPGQVRRHVTVYAFFAG